MRLIFYIFFFSKLVVYSQNNVESLINKVASDNIPENFNFYYLVEESLNSEQAFDSLEIASPNDFLFRFNQDLPKDLLLKVENRTVNWKEYNLDKVKYITQEVTKKIIPNIYDVYFVSNKISNDSLYNLNKTKGINTLILKKSKKWSEKKLWEEIKKIWYETKTIAKEQKICYSFSNPVFSNDKKYARISVFEYKACKGTCMTYLYKYENNTWILLAEFDQFTTSVSKTHCSCERLNVNLMN